MGNILDIFHEDPFSSATLTEQINKTPFLPTFLGDQNVFEAVPVDTIEVALEVEREQYKILDVTARGTAPQEETLPAAQLGSVRTRQISDSFTLYADSLQAVSRMPGSVQVDTMQAKVARGMAQMRRNIQATFEQSYLSAVQGHWTVNGKLQKNWYNYWGQVAASEINFELNADATDVVGKCEDVVTAMVVNSEGLIPLGTAVGAVCGSTFYKSLRNHKKVYDAHLQAMPMATLEAHIFDTFNFAGISFKHYRGTLDGSTIAVPATKAKFYPISTNNLFKVFYSPSDTFDTINTPGLPLYIIQIRDTQRNKWVKFEMYTYPLVACLQPVALQSARAS